jgi:hypothetical protein
MKNLLGRDGIAQRLLMGPPEHVPFDGFFQDRRAPFVKVGYQVIRGLVELLDTLLFQRCHFMHWAVKLT